MKTKDKKWRFVVGLFIKLFMLFIMVMGLIGTFNDAPDSAAAFGIFILLTLFGVVEHILNPRDELSGKYKIM